MSVFLPIFVIAAALIAYRWRAGHFSPLCRAQGDGGLRASLLSSAHLDARVLSGEYEGESPYAPYGGARPAATDADAGEADAFAKMALTLLTDEQRAFLGDGSGRCEDGDEDEDGVDAQEQMPPSVNEADVEA